MQRVHFILFLDVSNAQGHQPLKIANFGYYRVLLANCVKIFLLLKSLSRHHIAQNKYYSQSKSTAKV
ncbi:hypothetical protein FGO68_gene5818 [Halteria grandinella]|uniref:Uncharacterized protein n=1 Tax=Halteria grandinella TaxID=5974 RepID=A0A8J8NDN7_HALGN|nr:hypothetical protein FGO68_gene5818 [Halteria grandinella]